jgi:hypothetical protein
VAEVDPRDDGRTRWNLQWYRCDPERNERRYVPVSAFTRKREFDRAFRQLQMDLERRKSEGLSEDVESISGVKHEKGYLAGIRRMRLLDPQRIESMKDRPPESS